MVVAAALLLFAAAAGQERLPAPIEAAGADILLPPSASVRAATLARMAHPPASPVMVRLACDISPSTGEPRRCVLAKALPELRTWDVFEAAAGGFEKALDENGSGGAAATLAAYERVRVTRVRVPPSGPKPARKLMLFTEVIAAADARPGLPPGEAVPSSAATFEDPPGGLDAGRLYPETLLRNDDWATVTALCRVLPDRSLLCRGGEATRIGSLPPKPARLFVLMTYQLMSPRRVAPVARDGRPIVGRDIVVRINWRPEAL
jgi:hypothetical protein